MPGEDAHHPASGALKLLTVRKRDPYQHKICFLVTRTWSIYRSSYITSNRGTLNEKMDLHHFSFLFDFLPIEYLIKKNKVLVCQISVNPMVTSEIKHIYRPIIKAEGYTYLLVSFNVMRFLRENMKKKNVYKLGSVLFFPERRYSPCSNTGSRNTVQAVFSLCVSQPGHCVTTV